MDSLCPDGVLFCHNKTMNNIKQLVKLITLFLKEMSVLTEAYILDYFVENLWQKLPVTWQDTLQDFEPCDLELFLNFEKKVKCRKPWPLSLLAFRACACGLAFPRKSIQSLATIEKFICETSCQKTKVLGTSFDNTAWDILKNEFEEKSGQHKNIPEFCRRHVKPKKQHEIFRMAQLTAVVMKTFDMKHAIDIGSGQGHLSRLLALCYDLNVATVEANQCHVSGAVNFDKQALNTLQKSRSYSAKVSRESEKNDCKILPYHLEGSITPESSKLLLEEILMKTWKKDPTVTTKDCFALLGLHTCGDLATTILESFVKCDEAKVLLSVGCCYMKIGSKMAEKDYPLSSYVKSLSHPLSYEAKEVACHALEMYIQRLHEEAASLKIHCYRALLEKCILHHYPNSKHLGLRGVKHAELLEFSEYAERALKKVLLTIPKEYFLLPEIYSCLKEWKHVLTFYSVRLAIAPVVETLILLDRMIYLHEKGYKSCLAPVFDPSISPRNLVLLSFK